MNDIICVGPDTFGDIQKFMAWLHAENLALGNLKPIGLLTNSSGRELVLSELVHINHGLLT